MSTTGKDEGRALSPREMRNRERVQGKAEQPRSAPVLMPAPTRREQNPPRVPFVSPGESQSTSVVKIEPQGSVEADVNPLTESEIQNIQNQIQRAWVSVFQRHDFNMSVTNTLGGLRLDEHPAPWNWFHDMTKSVNKGNEPSFFRKFREDFPNAHFLDESKGDIKPGEWYMTVYQEGHSIVLVGTGRVVLDHGGREAPFGIFLEFPSKEKDLVLELLARLQSAPKHFFMKDLGAILEYDTTGKFGGKALKIVEEPIELHLNVAI